MANTKISNLTALGAAPALGDLLVLVDVSASETKRMTVQNLIDAVDGNANTFTALQSIEVSGLTGLRVTGSGASLAVQARNNTLILFDMLNTSDTLLGRIAYDVASGILDFQARGTSTQMTFKTATSGGTLTEAARFQGNQYLLIGYTASNGAYRLQVNSQIFATNATVATSDQRVKTNVADLVDGLTPVLALRPRVFDFVDHPVHEFSTQRQVGFVAQEVEAALAGAEYLGSVVPPTESEEQLKGMAAEKVVALLVRAVQQLDARVVALEQ